LAKEEEMIRMHVRMTGAIALCLALGVSALALADGAGDNEAFVDGSVKPRKLDKKEYKPIALFTEVRTEGPVTAVTGTHQNPEKELIEFDRDGAWRSNAAPLCTANIETPGLTTDQARGMCPAGSYIGSGEAEVNLGPARVSDITVSVFNGPAKNEIRLHTSSPTLTTAAPTVFGEVVKSGSKKFGPALLVENAPDAGGDAFMITKFNATIFKSSGVSLARCTDKKFVTRRTVTYDDGSQDVATDRQRCKQKKSGGN
jgi:hypothetical protein